MCPFSDNPRLVSHVPVTIQVLDVNDNIPTISGGNNIIIVCESTKTGQVGYWCSCLGEKKENSLSVFGLQWPLQLDDGAIEDGEWKKLNIKSSEIHLSPSSFTYCEVALKRWPEKFTNRWHCCSSKPVGNIKCTTGSQINRNWQHSIA